MRLVDRRGMLLLEALVALAIMSSAVIALIGIHVMARRAQARMIIEEAAATEADRLLIASSLLTRLELDQRLGRHEIGSYLIEVQRPERGLYRLSVRERSHPEVELLATVVAREDPAP